MKRLLLILFVSLFLLFKVNAQLLTEKQVPAAIKAVVAAKSGGLKVTSWVLDKRRERYVASIISKETFQNILINLQGKWLRTSRALSENKVPSPVMRTLRSNYLLKGYKGSNYTFVQDWEKGSYYLADLSSKKEDFKLTLSPAGDILKKELQ